MSEENKTTNLSFEDLDELVLAWAHEKGILQAKNPAKQALKLASECGELCDAVAKNDIAKIVDGIGDCAVVLIILSELYQIDMTECLEVAYSEIKNRTGVLQNGVFIKDE